MIITEDMLNAKSTDDLSNLLFTYCHRNNLSYESADGVLLQVLDQIEKLKINSAWLQGFITQWEKVQESEDTAAECKRNGHRDTGRGVCADCGDFI